jgi:hydrogenase/urease accessory protein HupE
MRTCGILGVFAVLLAIWPVAPVQSHEIRPAVATVSIPADGRMALSVSTNLEALLAGIGPEHKDTDDAPGAAQYNELRALAPDALKARFQAFAAKWLDGIKIELDGTRIAPEIAAVEVPAVGDIKLARISTVRLTGAVPPDAKTIRWTYPAGFGTSVLRVNQHGGNEPATVWLKDGAPSDPISLTAGPPKSRMALAWDYLVLGFTHILPKGLDHILFVLGLYLLSTEWRPLLVQVTAFTIAHSITLALGLYGVVDIPSSVVEPLIALSIVYVAVENILTPKLTPWRPFVVFGFGLLHGLGFAGVLQEIGLPPSEFVTGLISFNVGVEFGQLAVIGLAWLATGLWFRHKPWYRARIVWPASALIALAGLYWTIERVLGGGA